MLKWIRGNDQNNISHVSKNSKTFFKKELSEDVLGQTLYRWSAPDHPDGEVRPFVAGQGHHVRKEQDQLLPHRGGDERKRGEGEGHRPVRQQC